MNLGRSTIMCTTVIAGISALLVGGASPALADTGRCTLTPDGENAVCVYFSPTNRPGAQVYGQVNGLPISDLTQVVYICHTNNTACTPISASHSNPTSSKLISPGHAYKNCATFTDDLGVRNTGRCSPLVGVSLP